MSLHLPSFYSNPQTSKFVSPPPTRVLVFTFWRLSKNWSYPSIWFSWVLVIGFPWRFKSISGVLVNRSSGRGWGFLSDQWVECTEILLLFRERTFNLESCPMDEGKLTIELQSIASSVRFFRLPISSGTDVMSLFERSRLSSFTSMDVIIGLGTEERRLPCIFSCFSACGSFSGRGSTKCGVSSFGLPSKLSPTFRICNLVSLPMEFKQPGWSLFPERFRDFRFWRLPIFGSNVLSWFDDKSKVVNLVIYKRHSSHVRMLHSPW